MSLEVAKEAVSYYSLVMGETYDDFYSKLDTALEGEQETYDLWLIHQLMDRVLDYMSLDEFKANKDAIRGTVDAESRKLEGEFYTPLRWCEEGRKYFDKHIPDWGKFNVWDGSCGSGNLMRTSKHAQGETEGELFMSTLRKEDAEDVSKTFPTANVFQLDFLNSIDYDEANMEFVESLPERLQEILRNDEPLIIYMNPPYKAGSAKGTDVGRYMCELGLGRPATDIYYQFMWRVMSLVDRFNLKNTYFGVFGPLTYFTGASAGMLLKEFEYRFKFIDGMCLSAGEFSDTSESIQWGIGFSLWKALGVYNIKEGGHKDIILERKMTSPSGDIVIEGEELYAPPREKLSDWVIAKDVIAYDNMPLMTSYHTFKDGEGKVSPRSGKMARNSIGTMMTGNTLARNAGQSAVLSAPTTIQYTDITEENFWRCVSSFSFRRIVEVTWSKSKKELSAPLTHVDGYEEWLMNSIVYFLFEWKSMMSSIRGVDFHGSKVNILNKLFFISAEEVRENCDDPVILADLEKSPYHNKFMLEQIEKARPYWVPEVKDLFDFCKSHTLKTLNDRKLNGYKSSTDSWDAGFQQVRDCVWNEDLERELSKKVAGARNELRKGIKKFGFIDFD